MSTPINELRLDDGFSTLIGLANLPTVKIFEKAVTPPGMQAGGAINTTTMRNIAFRTSAPKQLKTLTQVTTTVAFATAAIPDIQSQIGVVQLITVSYPDGSTLAFYGWIDEFMPGSFSEGEQPTATLTVHPTMRDLDGEEHAPVYTEPTDSSGA